MRNVRGGKRKKAQGDTDLPTSKRENQLTRKKKRAGGGNGVKKSQKADRGEKGLWRLKHPQRKRGGGKIPSFIPGPKKEGNS